MRISRVACASSGMLAFAVAGLAPAAAQAAPPAATSAVVGHAYVNDNTAVNNSVAVLDRHPDGSLTTAPGSPFVVGGAGLGRGLGSQGAIQATRDGRFLLAVDAGSNSISVLRVGPRGVPTPVGTPVPSGGVQPVSIAISPANVVYVANVGAGGSNYAGFRFLEGRLTPIAGATVAVPEGSGAGDVLFNASGDRLVGTRDNTSLLDSFRVGLDGRLHAAAGSPFPAQAAGPIGAEFRPTDPSQLYVSNAHAGPGAGTVSAFSVSLLGDLRSIGSSPFADLQTAPCWVEISHDGRYLFAVNTGSGSISRYAVAADGSLALLGSTALKNGLGALDARLSPDGGTLSVTGERGLVVSVFAVHGGDLSELASSPTALPAGASPTGIAVL